MHQIHIFSKNLFKSSIELEGWKVRPLGEVTGSCKKSVCCVWKEAVLSWRVQDQNCLLCLFFEADFQHLCFSKSKELDLRFGELFPRIEDILYKADCHNTHHNILSSQTQGPMKSRGWTPSNRKKPMVTTPIWKILIYLHNAQLHCILLLQAALQ